jgi:hypothetical protein
MKLGKSGYRIALGAAILGIAAQPALASNKDKPKRSEQAAACNECCKPAVRSMSESTPVRKGDCPKTRRILM